MAVFIKLNILHFWGGDGSIKLLAKLKGKIVSVQK